MPKRHDFHYYHLKFWKELLVVMALVFGLFGWDYYTTPPELRGWRPQHSFYGTSFARAIQSSIIQGDSSKICLLDTDGDGQHDFIDEHIPVVGKKQIQVTWEKYDYHKIEIRNEKGLEFDDILSPGYRYEVPLKARHLFVPGVYAFRLINEYNPDCHNLVGRFRVINR